MTMWVESMVFAFAAFMLLQLASEPILAGIRSIGLFVFPTPPPTQPGGFRGWGGGVGPTGLTNSPSLNPGYGAAAKSGWGPVTYNVNAQLIFLSTGVPQMAQPLMVPPNSTVSIRAHNGTTAGNANPCRVALTREELLSGIGAQVLTPDTEISWPMDWTAVWAVGTAGDGIYVSVQRQRTM